MGHVLARGRAAAPRSARVREKSSRSRSATTEAEEGLLSCLAKGADRGVRIWDEGSVGADPLAIARVLAAAVERESPDLVLCGVQSSDAVNGATGIALAGLLDLPHVAVVKPIELDGSAAPAVERELEGGLVELLRICACRRC